MAEAVVGVLIGKLGAALMNQAEAYGAFLLDNEAFALKGLFGEIRKAMEELESMKAYLRESEKFKDTNETTDIFINKIRELSFQIEDVVDEFMYKVEDDKHAGLAAKLTKRIKHVKVWHRLAHKLRDILAEIEDATKRRDRYVILGMQGYAGSSGHHTRSTHQNLCFAREDDLVGIEDNATKLKHWLVGDLEEKNYKIATVWGMGGVGKTTLVDHVYKIVKLVFDAAAWVTVSKRYQVEDLLKRIAREFAIVTDATNMEIRSLVEIIRKHLDGKRYILVLDDVWEKDVWINDIMEVFPTNCTSRFVLTSRKFEVASLATSNCTVKLEPLGQKYSWKLFCKASFRNSDDKRCPSELHDLAAKFIQKCEGLPIAITCIGRLLAFKQPTHSDWDSVYKEIELQSINNVGVDNVLKLSLEDLPYELKNCFLHCAIFPEDYELRRRRLIRHWITSGFIRENGKKTLEQVAEGYLNDLLNRSLLQVVMKNEFGRVKCCRMHDVIRHLALDKAAKECFGKLYEGHGTFTTHGARRLSINSINIEPFNQSSATHLRAVYVCTGTMDIELLRSILASSALLSILDLQSTKIKMLPNEVFSLFNLRFLGVRNTQIEILPETIGRLQNLEVLDAEKTCLLSLPKDVAKLKKLRYLYASVRAHEGSFWCSRGVMVPRGIIKNLTGLHALQSIKASSKSLHEVTALTDLRTFAVDDVTSEHSLILCSAVRNMSNLVSLSITMSNENEVLPLEKLSLPDTLSKLALVGQLEKKRMPQILSSWVHVSYLTNLCLMFSKLDENTFASLMVLRNLCSLYLSKVYDGKKLCFSRQSFPRLKELYISGAPQLSQVEIEEDALGSLVKLWLADCPELKRLPHSMEYLMALDELYLGNTADGLIKVLRQEGESKECKEELMNIRHIRLVVFSVTGEKIWRRIVTREGNAFTG